jgi:predicted transposase YdaD
MFSLSDLRQTKVYQEALEEGRQEGELKAKWLSQHLGVNCIESYKSLYPK